MSWLFFGKMSRIVDSVRKLLFTSQEQRRERRKKSRHGIQKQKRRVRDRSVQYADSFIFLPGEHNNIGLSRPRAQTCVDDVLSSSPKTNAGTSGRLLGKSIKSRISQDVEDGFSRDNSRAVSFEGSLENPSTPPPPIPPPRISSVTYEIHCPPGEDIRPQSCHSLGREYATPSDCIRPTQSWYHDNSDLDSIDEGTQGKRRIKHVLSSL